MAYSTRAIVEIIWGKTNIEKWADANNNKNVTQIAERIVWAIASADAMIDSRLRGRGYTVPFSPVPQDIQDLSAKLAGVKLYQFPRGLTDGDDTSSAVLEAKEECETMLTNIHAGLYRLSSTRVGETTPVVFRDCHKYEGDTRAIDDVGAAQLADGFIEP